VEREVKDGVATGEFGRWLADEITKCSRCQGYLVYYDHGEPSEDPRVAAVKGFYGETVTNENRLADVDAIVAKPDGELIAVIEIEERPLVPKKLLGDVFTLLMCNRFAVREGDGQRYFEVGEETELIVAGVVSAKGKGLEKVRNVIEPRLSGFEGPEDGIRLEKVILVVEAELGLVIQALKKRMRQLCI
jgi:hypothetical protein